jgi:hypothetical protein
MFLALEESMISAGLEGVSETRLVLVFRLGLELGFRARFKVRVRVY